jgi:D-alanyl-D-alanine carboxypeptidase
MDGNSQSGEQLSITMAHYFTTSQQPGSTCHLPSASCPLRAPSFGVLRNSLPPVIRLLAIWVFGLLGLLTMGAGGPVLQGSQPGDLPMYPEQIAAYQAARQLPPLSAPAALLGDSATNQALAGLDANQSRAMASTTKIMTALLALERANLVDQVVISPTALVGGSTMGLTAGEVLSVEDLLWGLLLNSGNDAAIALAQHVAGSDTMFVQLMNQRAAELGMNNTRFANPHGLDAPDHYSSAFDLWLLTQEALRVPLFRQMVATQSHVAAGRQLFNRNELLGSYPGADGVKTGTTLEAGESLVGSVSRDGHRAVAVILVSQDRYADARSVFAHYFSHWRWAAAPQPAGPASWLWTADGWPLHVTASETPDLFLPVWQWPLVRPQLVLAPAGAEPGQPPGAIRWYLGNQLLAEAPAVLSDK